MPVNFDHVFYTYQAGTPFASVGVKDISLHINDNEFVALVGHTGSGKSTLGQLMNSLLRPIKGKIQVGDYLISAEEKKTKKLKELKKYAGLVFQFPEYQLFEETILKDVSFGPLNFGLKSEEATLKAKEALRLVGIDESLYEKSPFELSGGQKRRVAIAGIIALEPKILILDEPTAGLDPQGEKEMMKLFSLLHQQGTTIIMITHNMDLVLEYADRVIVMSRGEIISDSTPLHLFEKDKLTENYHIQEPMVLKYAKELNNAGMNLRLDAIKNVETLAEEIERNVRHG